MKRLSFFCGVSLLTFVIGLVTVWGYSLLSKPPLAAYALPSSPVLSKPLPDGEVEIKFLRIEKIEYGSYAEFRIVNGGTEPLYYPGYSKDDHCSYKIRRKGSVEQKNPCWCGTGLEERALHPGESATYQTAVTGASGEFEVGFDFEVGQARRKQTIWCSDIVTLSP